MDDAYYQYGENGDWESIKSLLDTGFPIDKPLRKAYERVGYLGSFLHAAAANRQVKLARHLLEHGADVSLPTPHWGNTPLHLAAETNCVEMADLLLRAGARVNETAAKKAKAGNLTPLHIAAGRGNPHMIAYLLANGADPNFQNNSGDTPLHSLVRENFGPDRLLAAKAFVASPDIDFRLKNKDGHTAIQWAAVVARSSNNSAVLKVLRRREPKWWKLPFGRFESASLDSDWDLRITSRSLRSLASSSRSTRASLE